MRTMKPRATAAIPSVGRHAPQVLGITFHTSAMKASCPSGISSRINSFRRNLPAFIGRYWEVKIEERQHAQTGALRGENPEL